MFSCTPEYTPLIKVIQNDSDQPDLKHGNRDRIIKNRLESVFLKINYGTWFLGESEKSSLWSLDSRWSRGNRNVDDIMLFVTLNWQLSHFRMLVTEFRSWWHLLNVVSDAYVTDSSVITKMDSTVTIGDSPTSQSCQKYISSSTSGLNGLHVVISSFWKLIEMISTNL